MRTININIFPICGNVSDGAKRSDTLVAEINDRKKTMSHNF